MVVVWEGLRGFLFFEDHSHSQHFISSPDYEGIDAVPVHTKSWYSTAVQVK